MIGAATNAWIAEAAGSAPVSAETLPGATTATVELVHLADGCRLVLKRFTESAFVAEDPDRAAHEAAILEALEPTAVPAPRLVAVDVTGERCGVPALLVSWIPGGPWEDGPPPVEPLAEAAAAVHATGIVSVWEYAPYTPPAGLRPPSWAQRRDVWEEALATAAGPPPATEAGFIHRDLHPGNIVWSGAGLVGGVVDWLAACNGPMAVDLALCRVNLALDHGRTVADRFLGAYLRTTESARRWDPRWDVVAAVDFLPWNVSVDEWHWGESGRSALEDFLAAAVEVC